MVLGSGSSSNITFETNAGTERMRITSGGNVLIGTTTDAGYKLDVNGTGRFSGNLRVQNASSGRYFDFVTDSSASYLDVSHSLNVRVNGASSLITALTIASTGAATFTSSVSGHSLTIQNTNSGYYSSSDYLDNSGTEKLIVGYGNSGAGALASKAIIYGTSGVGLNFYTNGSTTAKMVIDTTGNLGLGTNTPSGLARALVVTNTSDYAEIIVERLSSGAGKFGMLIGNSGDLLIRNYTAGTNPLIIAPSGGAATFSSSVTATGFFESSDSRLKTLIQDNYQTKGIASITPKLYTKNGKVELGYYAQDFVGILDSAVSKGSDDMLSLSYREALVAKVYALEQEIKELKLKLK
jgi:hypothetical protein